MLKHNTASLQTKKTVFTKSIVSGKANKNQLSVGLKHKLQVAGRRGEWWGAASLDMDYLIQCFGNLRSEEVLSMSLELLREV